MYSSNLPQFISDQLLSEDISSEWHPTCRESFKLHEVRQKIYYDINGYAQTQLKLLLTF